MKKLRKTRIIFGVSRVMRSGLGVSTFQNILGWRNNACSLLDSLEISFEIAQSNSALNPELAIKPTQHDVFCGDDRRSTVEVPWGTSSQREMLTSEAFAPILSIPHEQQSWDENGFVSLNADALNFDIGQRCRQQPMCDGTFEPSDDTSNFRLFDINVAFEGTVHSSKCTKCGHCKLLDLTELGLVYCGREQSLDIIATFRLSLFRTFNKISDDREFTNFIYFVLPLFF